MAERYDEKQVALILQKALERQHRTPGSGARSGGLTLDEVAAIGQEAGIDPALVRQAAADLGSAGPGRDWWGAPLGVSAEAYGPGPVGEEALKDLQIDLGALVRKSGQGLVHRDRLTWSETATAANTGMPQWQVSAGPGAEGFRVRVEARLGGLAGALYGGIAGGLGFPAALGAGLAWGLTAHTVAGPLLVGAAALGGSWLLARWIFRASARWYAREAQRLADLMADHLRP